MLFIILIVSVVLPAWGRPQVQQSSSSTGPPIPIISQAESVGGDGSFNFSFEAGNGIRVQEGGYLKNVQKSAHLSANKTAGSEESDTAQVITGSFSYTAPDGTEILIKYVADENGFQPEGAHLPTPPPIPPEIERALKLLPKTEQLRSVDVVQEAQQGAVDATETSLLNVEE